MKREERKDKERKIAIWVLTALVLFICLLSYIIFPYNTLSATFHWPVDNPNPMSNGYATFNAIGNNKYHTGFDLTSSTGSLIVRAAASGSAIMGDSDH
ncbi:MAG: hypothetical protein AB1638_10390 [Nitrospirota bacterium]